MKKKYIYYPLLIGAAMLFVSSCQGDFIPVEPDAPETLVGTPILFDTNVATPEAGSTRVAEILEAGTTMTVGMTVNGGTTYADYTYDGTSWKVEEGAEPLRWQDQVSHSFIAVSPARDMADLSVVLPGVYTEENITACEKLYSTVEALNTPPVAGISLPLKHSLVKIVIRTKNSEAVKLTKQKLSATIDTATGKLKAVDYADAKDEIAMLKSGTAFTAYILPRTPADKLSFYSYKEQTLPALDMPGGSSFSCTEAEKPGDPTVGGGFLSDWDWLPDVSGDANEK